MITHCCHEDNPDTREGNTTRELCPFGIEYIDKLIAPPLRTPKSIDRREAEMTFFSRRYQTMNLISCDNCGTVLDKNKIEMPSVYDNEGEFIEGNSVWSNGDYVPLCTCPVCKEKFEVSDECF